MISESALSFRIISAVRRLSAALGISRFQIAPGSTITLAATQANQMFLGSSWTLALGGQSIDGSTFQGASVSGIGTNTADSQYFINCNLGAVTLPGDTHCIECAIAGTQTLGEAGDFFYDRCHSGIAGTSTPVLDFGAALNASNLNIRNYSGGFEIQNMGAGTGSYTMSLEGRGQLVINANCSATSTVAIRGHFTVTDNAGGAVTLSDDARIDVAQINSEVDTALTDIGLDHLVAASVAGADITDDSIIAKLASSSATADWDTFVNTDDSLQAISEGGGGGPTAAQIADAVWDEDATGHQTGGTFGQAIGDPAANTETIYDAVVTDAAGTNVAADVIAVKAETALIVADTNELQTDDVPGLIATAQTDLDIITGADGVNLLSATQASIDAIETDTGTTLPATLAALNDFSVADVLTTQMTEAYAADGTAPTLTEAIMLIQQVVSEFAIASTTKTVKKLDGSTTAATFTLDDDTSPTSITRAT